MSNHWAFRLYIFSDNSHYNCAVMRLQEKMQEVKNEQKKRGYDLDLQSYPLSMMILHWKIPLSFIFDVLLQSAFSFGVRN